MNSVRYPLSMRRRLACVVFPERCLLCGKLVPAGVVFCPDCAACLPEGPCLREVRMPGRKPLQVASVLRYRDRWRRRLQSYKFHNCRYLARQLGWLMAYAARSLPVEEFDTVAYVPMGRKSRRERDYDQCRLLAENLGRFLGVPVVNALRKVKETKTQHELGRRERLHNLQGAYACGIPLTGKRVLLVDDIVTTGSTLRECAGELYRAGAAEVCAVCAADASRELRVVGAVYRELS